MKPEESPQEWCRRLVEVYTIKGEADDESLLNVANETDFNCSDFYIGDDDGYDGGVSECGSFTHSSNKMVVVQARIVGRSPGERTLFRLTDTFFTVTLHKPGVLYESIEYDVDTCVNSERWIENINPDDYPTATIDTVYIESKTYRQSGSTNSMPRPKSNSYPAHLPLL